jgi:hypothetical protein
MNFRTSFLIGFSLLIVSFLPGASLLANAPLDSTKVTNELIAKKHFRHHQHYYYYNNPTYYYYYDDPYYYNYHYPSYYRRDPYNYPSGGFYFQFRIR